MKMVRLGENISREWDEEPRASELWDVLQLMKSNAPAGLEMLEQLAESGSSLAQMYLGNIHMKGKHDLRTDRNHGEYWLRRSSAGGSIEGAYGLAWHLLNSGRTDEALTEYERIAELKYSPALYVLGCQYYKGEIVERDLERALVYFKLAEKEGHLRAANLICHILMREHKGALSWFCGLAKKIRLIAPFVSTAVKYPSSDLLRT